MRETLIKKACICFTGLLLLVTCAACGADAPYTVEAYLNDLAIASGLSDERNIEINIGHLADWGVLEHEEVKPEDELEYSFMCDTLGNLMGIKEDHFDHFVNIGWIDKGISPDGKVGEDKARECIGKAVGYINSSDPASMFEYAYVNEIKEGADELKVGDIFIEDNTYKIVTDVGEDGYSGREARFEEVFSHFELTDSFEIDFTEAEVIPYYPEDSAYHNENYNLLASNNHVFNKDGFRISYTVNTSGIDVHVSKNVEGLNFYLDLDVKNVKPTVRWAYEENDLKNCFFTVSMNTTQKMGVSDGKYGNYYLDFKDLDSSSFVSMLKSTVNPMKDKIEAAIPICKIKTPIPNVPTAKICMDLLIKLYASGKIEAVLYNSHQIGFETKNGSIRFINDRVSNFDAIINASGKAAMGINVSLEAAGFNLADIELDTGVKAEVKSTMHLYDESGEVSKQSSDISYSALQEISKENENVKICGDVSLYWLMDLMINTSKTKMASLGFSKTYHIMDDDDQIFGNLHHIENGHFVEKCTRKGKANIKTMETVKSDKIVLDSYAEVLNINETYSIIVKALPENYKEADLVYESEDSSIATVSGGVIKAIKPGSVRIEVKTKDGSYKSYVNILVSTG